MKRLSVLPLALLLAACGSSGGGDTGIVDTSAGVHIRCADYYQGATSPKCDPAPVAALDWLIGTANAAIDVNAGNISLTPDPLTGFLVLPTVLTDTANPLSVEKTVFIEIAFDAQCAGNGVPGVWVIYPKQQRQIGPGLTDRLGVGGLCPLGPGPLTRPEDITTVDDAIPHLHEGVGLGLHTLTATVWDTDGTTVLDIAVVRFNLVP